MPEALWLQATLGGVFGLVVGSFLTGVIVRVPKFLVGKWAYYCA